VGLETSRAAVAVDSKAQRGPKGSVLTVFPVDDTLMPLAQLDFDSIVRQAEREFMGLQQRRQPDLPFSHYTDARGLEGIISKANIWASDYRKLNDSGELIIGENAVTAELSAVIRESPEDTAQGFISREVEERRQGRRIIDITDIYITSFSREGDLPGQWRAPYGADGEGFSICFRSLPLPTVEEAAASLDSEVGVDFRPCVYRQDDFRAYARQVLVEIATGYEKYVLTYCHGDDGEQLEGELRHQAVSSALAKLGSMVPFLKHHGFADEREWRLIHVGTPPVKLTRTSPRYGEIDYFEVSLIKPDRMDLAEIIAGPLVKDLDFARTTLDRYGYADVPVRRSELPYR
jgi:hypothetical protein